LFIDRQKYSDEISGLEPWVAESHVDLDVGDFHVGPKPNRGLVQSRWD